MKTTEVLNGENVKKRKYRKPKSTNSNTVTSIVCIVCFSMSFIFHLLLTIFSQSLLYPYENVRIYEIWSFYVCLISALIIIVTSFTIKKLSIFKSIAIILFILLFIPLTIICTFQANYDAKSYTTDVNNYGKYDYSDNYILDEYFPDEITENMTPIYFSYFLRDSMDVVYELYLEVEMSNEEYKKYKSQYENDLKECFFAPKYTEYVLSDKTSVYTIYSHEEDYMDSPDIRKILFNDEERIIIFVSIYGLDPFYYENSYYFKRFNLDPQEYNDYLKENQK